MSGSITSHRPPASPQPIRGMCTDAPSSFAFSLRVANAVSIAAYLTGGSAGLGRYPRCPIMFATKTSSPTGTICTAPSAKSFVALARYHDRYEASGSGHRRESATTNPLPQPPASLQTCATTREPAPFGAIASPTTYSISRTMPPTVSPPTDTDTDTGSRSGEPRRIRAARAEGSGGWAGAPGGGGTPRGGGGCGGRRGRGRGWRGGGIRGGWGRPGRGRGGGGGGSPPSGRPRGG